MELFIFLFFQRMYHMRKVLSNLNLQERTLREHRKILQSNGIVANHRTMYHPYHGPSISLDTAIGKKIRETYHPLFEVYGVDVVLQGHVHYYQRTYPIKYNDKDSDVPLITDLDKNSYNNPEGMIFLTVGTGGVGIGRPDNIGKPYYTAMSNTGVFGILNIKIKNDGSSLEGTFYSNDNSSNNQQVSDSFKITKNTS